LLNWGIPWGILWGILSPACHKIASAFGRIGLRQTNFTGASMSDKWEKGTTIRIARQEAL
jgi:hypothetical protein